MTDTCTGPLIAALGIALASPSTLYAQQFVDTAEREMTGGSRQSSDVSDSDERPARSTLPTIKIKAAADRTITEDTGSYTTGATRAATGLPLALRDTPQSVTVITRQRMDDQQMNSVTEVLENTTGVSSYAQDGQGGRVTFYSRGFEITNFEYDGIPTTNLPNTFVPGEGVQDGAFYDRVEVVRGAAGLLSGTGNPSATVNLVRKRPGKAFSVSGSVGGGSWDAYRAVLDVSTPLSKDGRIRARVVGAYEDSHSFLDHATFKRKSFYGVIDADLTSHTTLSLGYEFQNANPKGLPWGGQPLFFSDGSLTHWSRSTNAAASWNTWKSTAKTVFADFDTHFDNGWTLHGELTQKRADSDARLLSTLGYVDSSTGAGLIPVATHGIVQSKQTSVDLMASGPFRLLGRRHELVFGGMASRRTSDDRETGFVFPSDPIANFYNWSGNYPEPAFDSLPHTLTQTRINQGGVYGAGRLSLADPLKLILGGRVSYYDVDQNTAGSAFHDRKSARFVPYAGIVYDLNDIYSAYASYTEIFNPQTSRDRGGNILAPTTGKNTEIGIKGEYLNGRLNGSLALFEAKLDHVAQIDTGHLLADGTQSYYAANGTTSKGVEFELQGKLTNRWNVFAGVSHFTASDNTGSRLSSQIPRTTARVSTTYRLPGELTAMTVGGSVNWQSRFYQMATSSNGVVVVGQNPYAIASLMARYDVSKNAAVQVNVNNLFDKSYYTMTGFYNQALFGEPRNFMVTLSYKL